MSDVGTLYDTQGRPTNEVVGLFDRGWLLNGYEQATGYLTAEKYAAQLGNFDFGHNLVIEDELLDIWGGTIDTPQSWSSTGVIKMEANSGERIFETRPYPGEVKLQGKAGSIFKQIIDKMNTAAPVATLMRAADDIHMGGTYREETITAKKLYDDVTRIASRSGNDFYVEPVIKNGILHFEGHWYEKRGTEKQFALEEGVNFEAKKNVMEYQGEIWNYIFAYGSGSTWADRVPAIALDQASIDRYGLRMYALAVESSDKATIQAHADAFCYIYSKPRRSFNITVGGKQIREAAAMTAFKVLRIGDIVRLSMYKTGYDNGRRGVETRVRIIGLIYRAKKRILDVLANEVRS